MTKRSAVAALGAVLAVLIVACGTTIAGVPLGAPGAGGDTAPTVTSEAEAKPPAGEVGEPGTSTAEAPDPADTVGQKPPTGSWAGAMADQRHVVPPEKVSTTWEVTPKSDAVILDYDFAEEALLDFDSAAGRWEFAPGALASAGLVEGHAMLVAGRGMGRITSIDIVGDRTVVHTSAASLADIIQDGTMAWDAAVDFGETWAVDDTPAGLRSPRLAGAYAVDSAGNTLRAMPKDASDGLTKWTFKDGDTEYTFHIVPGAGSTDVTIQVRRNELTFTATGTVGAMRSMGQATFKDGKLSTSKVDHDGLGGNLRLSMAAAGAGSGDLEMDVPGLMFKYIVPVGPVPVTMGITAQVIGQVTVPVDASVLFESNFSYTGQAGLTYTGSEVNAKGQLGNLVMDPKGADPVGFIGSTVQAQFGVSFPKVSLSIFETGLVPSLQPAIFLGTTLTWGPVCKEAYIRAELLLGYDLKAFGVSFAKGKETIWEKRRETKGDSCS